MRGLLLGLVCGCSWVSVTRPPENPGQPPIECTRTPLAPILDTAFAAVAIVGAGTFLDIYANANADDKSMFGEGAAVFAAYGILAAASAYSGYVSTARCRALNVTAGGSP